MQADLKSIQAIVDDPSTNVWLDRFFFNTIHSSRCRMSQFLEEVQKGDVTYFRKLLEAYKKQMDQSWEEQVKRIEEDRIRRQLAEEKLRSTVPSADILATFTVAQVKNVLRQCNLSLQGRKSELIQRLLDFKRIS